MNINDVYISIASIGVYVENKKDYIKVNSGTLFKIIELDDTWIKIENTDEKFWVGKWYNNCLRKATAEEIEEFSESVIEKPSANMIDAMGKLSKDFNKLTKELKKELGKMMAEGKKKQKV